MNGQSQRFLSLDVFRGMTICFMIIVNTPGSGAVPFSPLEHAQWHGFTPTDLVFPSFLFAVGNAMSFSLRRYREISDAVFLKKILKRTILIFLLGYLMYWFPFFRVSDTGHIIGAPIENTRIMGVLQRIALSYLFASLLIHYLKPRKVMLASILLLVGYWIVLQDRGKGYETISKLMLTGALFIFVALWWNMVFPINKKLWSSPFVLLTTGIDLMLISALVYLLEIENTASLKWTRFFLVFGKNPLFIYILSEVLVTILYMVQVAGGVSIFSWINSTIFQVIAPGAWGSFLFALIYMLVCWSVGWWLDRRKIYIKV